MVTWTAHASCPRPCCAVLRGLFTPSKIRASEPPCERHPSAYTCFSSLWVVSNYHHHIWRCYLRLYRDGIDWGEHGSRRSTINSHVPLVLPSSSLLPDSPSVPTQVSLLWFRRWTAHKVRHVATSGDTFFVGCVLYRAHRFVSGSNRTTRWSCTVPP